MAGVTLNEVPKAGDDLEDYVAALFQAAGFFVEKNMTERDPTEVLELDIVATDYSTGRPKTIVAEVKGGNWGYPDLFKLAGWMQYLDIDRGAFFVHKDSDKDLASVATKIAKLGISLVHFEDYSRAAESFEESGLGKIVPDNSSSVWRYAYGVERRLAKYLLNYKKSNPEKEGPKAALEYHRLVSDGIFFANSTVESVRLLYDAYIQHPKLSLAVAREVEGKDFDPDCQSQPNRMMREAIHKGEHPLLQACFYVEHRARLAIFKAAVDLLCDFQGEEPPLDPDGSDVTRSIYRSLPSSFHSGLEWLTQQPNACQYALLWQQFLWGWGGFFLDNRDEELANMAHFSGVPVEEVPSALTAFDRFFPSSDWFTTPGPTNARRLKMTPAYFQGLGVYRRRTIYNWDTRLSQVRGEGYTAQDLSRWNNLAVAFLR